MSVGRAGDAGAAESARAAAEAAARRAAEAAARAAAEAAARRAAEAARNAMQAHQRSSFDPVGAKSTERIGGPGAPATSLFTEDTKDASVNCLDKAADWVSKSSPELRSRSELVFLKDSRAGAEGQAGHVVVRQGERVLDPSSGKGYDDMKAYLRDKPYYSEAGSMQGAAAAKVFSTEPGSPERAKALAEAKVSPELQRMMVADPQVSGEAPNAATAQPHSVTVTTPGQGPVSVEFSDELDKKVKKQNGYTTVTLTAEMEVSASGSLDMKKVSVGAGLSAGKTQTYEVKMKDADFERLKRGEIPPPHPLKAETIPDGCSVTMEAAQLKGWSDEVSVSVGTGIKDLEVELGLSEEQKKGKGMSIQAENKGGKLQVTAGPTEVFESGLSVSVGTEHAKVSLTGTTNVTDYKLRTAEFDITGDAGRNAFKQYAQSGKVPTAEGPGVSGIADVRKQTITSSSELEGELGPLKGSLEVTPENGVSFTETTFPDKSRDTLLEAKKPDGTEASYARHFNPDGAEDTSKQEFKLFFKGMEGSAEELYAQAYSVDQHKFDKENDVQLTFTPDQMMQLSQRARDYVDKMRNLNSQHAWNPGNAGDAFIDALSKAKTPEEVAGALTQYSGDRNWMGEAMAKMQSIARAPTPGTIEAKNRNDA